MLLKTCAEAEKLETFRYYTEPAARPRRPAPAIAYNTEPTAKGVIPELPDVYEGPQRARARSTPQASRSSGPGPAARGQTERRRRTGPAAIRQVAALTQASQASRSRLEARPDLLLSTMKAHFDALGTEATISIRIGGTEHRARLDELI